MKLKVFKFGGASVIDADGFRNVGQILQKYANDKIVVVVSAIGKTTNALEEVVKSYFNSDGNTEALINQVKASHLALAAELIPMTTDIYDDLSDAFVEVDWLVETDPEEDFDYIYDQIVPIGEVLSSKILAHYLAHIGLSAVWGDVRDIIITDNTYRDAKVLWDITIHNAKSKLLPQLQSHNLVITQGFIGSTTENFTTTLGREGSDYTAAILSYCLDAQSMHIWKDVPGVLTGDPRIFEDVSKLPRLTYKEAIEMTYYGAKVIHPKTIKPIQNKQIPLYVRPFLDPESEGTIISDEKEMSYPPVVVIESDQTLVHISTNDFSFVAEHHLSMIFALLAKHRLKVKMMRNTAISFTVCIDHVPDRIAKFEEELGIEFKMIQESGLELMTIRHYNDEVLAQMKAKKLILFEEKLQDIVQLITKSVPTMRRKDNEM